jgi:hypothetical protein
MSWHNAQIDANSYVSIPASGFKASYPGLIDHEIEIIGRIQSIFQIFEDGNYQQALPREQAARVNEFRNSFMVDILGPLTRYNGREERPFGGKYTTNEFTETVQSFFNNIYVSISPIAALLKAEIFDYRLIDKFPGQDMLSITSQLEELKKKTKAFPSVVTKIDEAEKAADEWIKKQSKVLEQLIETKSRELDKAAQKHRGFVQVIWAALAVALGFISYEMGLDTVNAVRLEPTSQISLGFGLVKLSSVIAPLLAAYICFSQYSYHRSMHDALSFRAIALSNLATLSKQYPDSKNLIFEKGIDLIFDEPKSKIAQINLKDLKDLLQIVKGK